MEEELLVKLVKKVELKDNMYKFSFASNSFNDACPGQFLKVRVVDESGIDTYKAFPIFNIDRENSIVEIIFSAVDQDTKIIKDYEMGDLVNIEGPFGTSFDSKTKYNSVSIISEGKNPSPIYELTKELKGNASLNVYLAFNTEKDVLLERELEEIGLNKLCITTLDGSYKEKGNAIDFMKTDISEHMVEKIFACGSKEFLENVKAYSDEKGISCEMFIENNMNENGPVISSKDLV